jgi:hypothetical protein
LNVEGKITSTFAEDVDKIINYLPISLHLSHNLTVPITELQKLIGLDMAGEWMWIA